MPKSHILLAFSLRSCVLSSTVVLRLYLRLICFQWILPKTGTHNPTLSDPFQLLHSKSSSDSDIQVRLTGKDRSTSSPRRQVCVICS